MFSKNYSTVYVALIITLVLVFLLSLRFGTISIQVNEIISAFSTLFSNEEKTLLQRIFLDIRLPRAINCISVGASLAMAGVLMQALFRNPIVEPGLIGTSSGAALGASFYFVLGTTLKINAGVWTLPIAACIGAALATVLVFLLSEGTGSKSITSLLLTGIAVNALCISGVGLMSYLARDPQARSITFWNLGTLSGSTWSNVILIGSSTVISFFISLRLANALNTLAMGEDEAIYLGVDIRKLKIIVVSVTVMMVAVATAFVGVISFVGLIVPHLLRLTKGFDNRFLLIGSALLGGIIVSLADLAARLWLAPAELPIGIVTAAVGVPVFIFLLRKNKQNI